MKSPRVNVGPYDFITLSRLNREEIESADLIPIRAQLGLSYDSIILESPIRHAIILKFWGVFMALSRSL